MHGVSIVLLTTQLGTYAKFMPKTGSYHAILHGLRVLVCPSAHVSLAIGLAWNAYAASDYWH